ncbi:MAG: hypothetical protein V4457_12835 [Pseudomonadota bacterium]
MSESTIQTDVQEDDPDVLAFLSSFEDDPKKGPAKTEEGAPETQDETPEQTEETTEGEPEEVTETEPDPEDQEFEIKVGEETKKATLRDLKRLYGQEAALTQKSQKASEQLRVAEADIARTAAVSKAMIERAQERYKPYAALGVAEWAQLATQLSGEQYEALRLEVDGAKRDVDFLTNESSAFMQEQQNKAVQAHHQAAAECIKVLSDPATGIEGWGQPLYNEIISFAADNGLAEVKSMLNPAAYKLLHMAMQWSKHKATAKTAEAKAKAAVEQPTRVMKPGKPRDTSSDKQKLAMKALKESGSVDDATDAFMASF